MRFYSVRDLRTNIKEIRESLDSNEEAIITNNGKPFAIMIPISEGDFDTVLDAVQQTRALKALRETQVSAAKRGIANMTLEEINSEIAAARCEMQ